MTRTVLEANLVDVHGWLQLLWEHTSDAMALSDETGLVLAANPAYYRLYGYGPGERGKSDAQVAAAAPRIAQRFSTGVPNLDLVLGCTQQSRW